MCTFFPTSSEYLGSAYSTPSSSFNSDLMFSSFLQLSLESCIVLIGSMCLFTRIQEEADRPRPEKRRGENKGVLELQKRERLAEKHRNALTTRYSFCRFHLYSVHVQRREHKRERKHGSHASHQTAGCALRNKQNANQLLIDNRHVNVAVHSGMIKVSLVDFPNHLLRKVDVVRAPILHRCLLQWSRISLFSTYHPSQPISQALVVRNRNIR